MSIPKFSFYIVLKKTRNNMNSVFEKIIRRLPLLNLLGGGKMYWCKQIFFTKMFACSRNK